MPRRQLFGVLLLLVALAVLLLAMWTHLRRLSYVAIAAAAVGVWMLMRRAQR